MTISSRLLICLIIQTSWMTTLETFAADPLPSWNDGPNKTAIIEFLNRVTDKTGEDYVKPEHRIVTIDNDGTLWSEQPLYFQAFYVFDRIKKLSTKHPEWKEQEPFASVLKGDIEAALSGGETALLKMTMATHAGMTTEEFSESVSNWMENTRHPTSGKPFTKMVFQPMLELLDYLRENECKVFIVSGGGIDFVRVFSERVYGIPRERVIGSSIDSKYEIRDGKPVIVKLAKLNLIDDHAGKPVGIHRYIGRRPFLAIGNSDGDFEMLEWTMAGRGPRLSMIVHHDDAIREWSYDRESYVGRLSRGLEEGPKRGWKIISMKSDWRTVHLNANHSRKSNSYKSPK